MILKRRHIAKSITYRVIGTIFTILLATIATGDINVGLVIGPIDCVIKIVIYYIHERSWTRISFGIIQNNDDK